MSVFGGLALLIFIASLLSTYFISRWNKVIAQKIILLISILMILVFLFFKLPFEIYHSITQGGIIPYDFVNGASNDTISKIFLLDICNMFSILIPITFVLYYKNKTQDLIIAFSIIGILGSLFTMFGTVANESYDLNAETFFKYITVGTNKKPVFFLEHFIMAIVSFNILISCKFIDRKIYMKTFYTIITYVIYVLIMSSIFGLTQSISALGINDFFLSKNIEEMVNVNTNELSYTKSAYKEFMVVFNLKNGWECVLVTWTFFVIFANLTIIAKNLLFTFIRNDWSFNKTYNDTKNNIMKNYYKAKKYKDLFKSE